MPSGTWGQGPGPGRHSARLPTTTPWCSRLWPQREAAINERTSRDGLAGRIHYRATVIAWSCHRANTLSHLVASVPIENAYMDRAILNSPDDTTPDVARILDRDALNDCPPVRAKRLLGRMCSALPRPQGWTADLQAPKEARPQGV